MGTGVYKCGCSITIDMFNSKLISIHHCREHFYLFSIDKTIRQMSEEIIKICV